MLKIYSIPNMERFLSLVARSRGQVLLHLPANSQHDLKGDSALRQLFQTMKPGREGVRISLSDPSDIPAFINYMIGV